MTAGQEEWNPTLPAAINLLLQRNTEFSLADLGRRLDKKLKRSSSQTCTNLQTGFCNLHGLDVTPEGEQGVKLTLQTFLILNGHRLS